MTVRPATGRGNRIDTDWIVITYSIPFLSRVAKRLNETAAPEEVERAEEEEEEEEEYALLNRKAVETH